MAGEKTQIGIVGPKRFWYNGSMASSVIFAPEGEFCKGSVLRDIFFKESRHSGKNEKEVKAERKSRKK